MLYIWHSGCFMKPTHKWYFWPFLYPKIAFFVIFAQICPKNMNFWMVDITFFVFVVSRDWRYMLEVYYYTFKKIKKIWSLPTSVGPVHPSKSKTIYSCNYWKAHFPHHIRWIYAAIEICMCCWAFFYIFLDIFLPLNLLQMEIYKMIKKSSYIYHAENKKHFF